MFWQSLGELERTHGTVQLIDRGGNLQLEEGTDIVLIPQPNRNDPNDPLSWPRWKRLTAYWVILFYSGIVNFQISGISPGFRQLSEEFHVTNNQLTYLITLPGCGMGIGVFAIAPLALYLGKRPIWLGCVGASVICNIWAAVSPSYASLLAARFVAAVAGGSSEPVGLSVLNDLFFLHERGAQSGIQALALSIGNSLAPIICGFLVESKGWRIYHWLITALCGFNFLLVIFLSPETAYNRNLHSSMDVAGIDADAPDSVSSMPQEEFKGEAVMAETISNTEMPAKRTFLQELKPWNTPRKDINLVAAYLRPWIVWAYPSFIWAEITYALHVTALIIILSLIPLNLSVPPYNFTTSQIGLTYIANLIGNLIGCYTCGHLGDALAKYSARRNNGVFEPEMRLPLVVIPALAGLAGLLLYGIGIAKGVHWIVPVIGDGLVGVALTGFPSFAQPYLIDSYFPIATDAMITFTGMKNFLYFGIGFGIEPWVEKDGLIAVFSIFAGIVFLFDVASVLVWYYGKRLRVKDTAKKIIPF
ncbi:major facilitator superfamily domain-containing protein [Xylogone sp. PMI_703]|nr:major facilitator superfamily domain-containing protein [Xylogone sp. PMI_703]